MKKFFIKFFKKYFSKEEKITEGDEEKLTTAKGLMRYAKEYIESAQVVDEHIGSRRGYELRSPMPAYYLMYHGIELTLKAYLRHKGVTVRQLSQKKYGHDLMKCKRQAMKIGLGNHYKFSRQDNKALEQLLELNKFQGLRYIRTGWKDFPSMAIVEPIAVNLHKSIAILLNVDTFQ